jgi:hypothetical protein
MKNAEFLSGTFSWFRYQSLKRGDMKYMFFNIIDQSRSGKQYRPRGRARGRPEPVLPPGRISSGPAQAWNKLLIRPALFREKKKI